MKVHIIGEDQRSNYLRRLYENDIVSIKEADTIICPIPFTRDNIKINNSNMSIEELINIPDVEFKKIYTGALNSFAKEKLNEKNIKVIDIMEDEAYAIKNAIATAEGAIKKVIDSTPFTIILGPFSHLFSHKEPIIDISESKLFSPIYSFINSKFSKFPFAKHALPIQTFISFVILFSFVFICKL